MTVIAVNPEANIPSASSMKTMAFNNKIMMQTYKNMHILYVASYVHIYNMYICHTATLIHKHGMIKTIKRHGNQNWKTSSQTMYFFALKGPYRKLPTKPSS